MPIRVSAHRLAFERPLPRALDLATASATLRGAYRTALALGSCAREGECARRADVEKEPVRCVEPLRCPNAVLYEAVARHRAREHPPAATLWVDASLPDRLDGTLVLWGQRAVAFSREACRALDRAGRPGLRAEAGSWVRFRNEEISSFAGTLGAWVERAASSLGERLLVELVSPCDTGRDRRGEPAPFELASVLGDLAHDLAQWSLEEADPELPKRAADARCDAIRAEVRAAAAELTIDGGGIAYVQLPSRTSRGSGKRFPLGGYQGYCTLRGDLRRLWPWLATLELRGGGQHRQFGLGRFRLWRIATSARELI